MSNVLLIGRKAHNHVVIDDKRISGQHCKISRLANGDYLLEDLDSSNGSFIDGRQVASILVNKQSQCRLAEFNLNLRLLLSIWELEPIAKGTPYAQILQAQSRLDEQKAIYTQFEKLEAIYQQYVEDKKKLRRKAAYKNSGIRAGLALIPIVGTSLAMLSSSTDKTAEKQIDLTEQFKLDYVCPKCNNFLGDIPFENLRKRGTCNYCKTAWVEEAS